MIAHASFSPSQLLGLHQAEIILEKCAGSAHNQRISLFEAGYSKPLAAFTWAVRCQILL
jgi:hypothetical protein